MPRTSKDFSKRKDQLVKIALARFIENGYEQTTISQLQQDFGLTKGGMYHYFKSKEEILDAVIEYGLKQSVEEMLVDLETIPLEKKLSYFFFSSSKNEFSQNLFRYSKKDPSSIVAYRFREKAVELLSPVLKAMIHQSIEAGFYQSDYPDEMAEICLLLALALTEEGLLPQTDLVHRKKRVDNFLDLWSKCMKPPVKHIQELQASLDQLICET